MAESVFTAKLFGEIVKKSKELGREFVIADLLTHDKLQEFLKTCHSEQVGATFGTRGEGGGVGSKNWVASAFVNHLVLHESDRLSDLCFDLAEGSKSKFTLEMFQSKQGMVDFFNSVEAGSGQVMEMMDAKTPALLVGLQKRFLDNMWREDFGWNGADLTAYQRKVTALEALPDQGLSEGEKGLWAELKLDVADQHSHLKVLVSALYFKEAGIEDGISASFANDFQSFLTANPALQSIELQALFNNSSAGSLTLQAFATALASGVSPVTTLFGRVSSSVGWPMTIDGVIRSYVNEKYPNRNDIESGDYFFDTNVSQFCKIANKVKIEAERSQIKSEIKVLRHPEYDIVNEVYQNHASLPAGMAHNALIHLFMTDSARVQSEGLTNLLQEKLKNVDSKVFVNDLNSVIFDARLATGGDVIDIAAVKSAYDRIAKNLRDAGDATVVLTEKGHYNEILTKVDTARIALDYSAETSLTRDQLRDVTQSIHVATSNHAMTSLLTGNVSEQEKSWKGVENAPLDLNVAESNYSDARKCYIQKCQDLLGEVRNTVTIKHAKTLLEHRLTRAIAMLESGSKDAAVLEEVESYLGFDPVNKQYGRIEDYIFTESAFSFDDSKDGYIGVKPKLEQEIKTGVDKAKKTLVDTCFKDRSSAKVKAQRSLTFSNLSRLLDQGKNVEFLAFAKDIAGRKDIPDDVSINGLLTEIKTVVCGVGLAPTLPALYAKLDAGVDNNDYPVLARKYQNINPNERNKLNASIEQADKLTALIRGFEAMKTSIGVPAADVPLDGLAIDALIAKITKGDRSAIADFNAVLRHNDIQGAGGHLNSAGKAQEKVNYKAYRDECQELLKDYFIGREELSPQVDFAEYKRMTQLEGLREALYTIVPKDQSGVVGVFNRYNDKFQAAVDVMSREAKIEEIKQEREQLKAVKELAEKAVAIVDHKQWNNKGFAEKFTGSTPAQIQGLCKAMLRGSVENPYAEIDSDNRARKIALNLEKIEAVFKGVLEYKNQLEEQHKIKIELTDGDGIVGLLKDQIDGIIELCSDSERDVFFSLGPIVPPATAPKIEASAVKDALASGSFLASARVSHNINLIKEKLHNGVVGDVENPLLHAVAMDVVAEIGVNSGSDLHKTQLYYALFDSKNILGDPSTMALGSDNLKGYANIFEGFGAKFSTVESVIDRVGQLRKMAQDGPIADANYIFLTYNDAVIRQFAETVVNEFIPAVEASRKEILSEGAVIKDKHKDYLLAMQEAKEIFAAIGKQADGSIDLAAREKSFKQYFNDLRLSPHKILPDNASDRERLVAKNLATFVMWEISTLDKPLSNFVDVQRKLKDLIRDTEKGSVAREFLQEIRVGLLPYDIKEELSDPDLHTAILSTNSMLSNLPQRMDGNYRYLSSAGGMAHRDQQTTLMELQILADSNFDVKLINKIRLEDLSTRLNAFVLDAETSKLVIDANHNLINALDRGYVANAQDKQHYADLAQLNITIAAKRPVSATPSPDNFDAMSAAIEACDRYSFVPKSRDGNSFHKALSDSVRTAVNWTNPLDTDADKLDRLAIINRVAGSEVFSRIMESGEISSNFLTDIANVDALLGQGSLSHVAKKNLTQVRFRLQPLAVDQCDTLLSNIGDFESVLASSGSAENFVNAVVSAGAGDLARIQNVYDKVANLYREHPSNHRLCETVGKFEDLAIRALNPIALTLRPDMAVGFGEKLNRLNQYISVAGKIKTPEDFDKIIDKEFFGKLGAMPAGADKEKIKNTLDAAMSTIAISPEFKSNVNVDHNSTRLLYAYYLGLDHALGGENYLDHAATVFDKKGVMGSKIIEHHKDAGRYINDKQLHKQYADLLLRNGKGERAISHYAVAALDNNADGSFVETFYTRAAKARNPEANNVEANSKAITEKQIHKAYVDFDATGKLSQSFIAFINESPICVSKAKYQDLNDSKDFTTAILNDPRIRQNRASALCLAEGNVDAYNLDDFSQLTKVSDPIEALGAPFKLKESFAEIENILKNSDNSHHRLGSLQAVISLYDFAIKDGIVVTTDSALPDGQPFNQGKFERLYAACKGEDLMAMLERYGRLAEDSKLELSDVFPESFFAETAHKERLLESANRKLSDTELLNLELAVSLGRGNLRAENYESMLAILNKFTSSSQIHPVLTKALYPVLQKAQSELHTNPNFTIEYSYNNAQKVVLGLRSEAGLSLDKDARANVDLMTGLSTEKDAALALPPESKSGGSLLRVALTTLIGVVGGFMIGAMVLNLGVILVIGCMAAGAVVLGGGTMLGTMYQRNSNEDREQAGSLPVIDQLCSHINNLSSNPSKDDISTLRTLMNGVAAKYQKDSSVLTKYTPEMLLKHSGLTEMQITKARDLYLHGVVISGVGQGVFDLPEAKGSIFGSKPNPAARDVFSKITDKLLIAQQINQRNELAIASDIKSFHDVVTPNNVLGDNVEKAVGSLLDNISKNSSLTIEDNDPLYGKLYKEVNSLLYKRGASSQISARITAIDHGTNVAVLDKLAADLGRLQLGKVQVQYFKTKTPAEKVSILKDSAQFFLRERLEAVRADTPEVELDRLASELANLTLTKDKVENFSSNTPAQKAVILQDVGNFVRHANLDRLESALAPMMVNERTGLSRNDVRQIKHLYNHPEELLTITASSFNDVDADPVRAAIYFMKIVTENPSDALKVKMKSLAQSNVNAREEILLALTGSESFVRSLKLLAEEKNSKRGADDSEYDFVKEAIDKIIDTWAMPSSKIDYVEIPEANVKFSPTILRGVGKGIKEILDIATNKSAKENAVSRFVLLPASVENLKTTLRLRELPALAVFGGGVPDTINYEKFKSDIADLKRDNGGVLSSYVSEAIKQADLMKSLVTRESSVMSDKEFKTFMSFAKQVCTDSKTVVNDCALLTFLISRYESQIISRYDEFTKEINQEQYTAFTEKTSLLSEQPAFRRDIQALKLGSKCEVEDTSIPMIRANALFTQSRHAAVVDKVSIDQSLNAIQASSFKAKVSSQVAGVAVRTMSDLSAVEEQNPGNRRLAIAGKIEAFNRKQKEFSALDKEENMLVGKLFRTKISTLGMTSEVRRHKVRIDGNSSVQESAIFNNTWKRQAECTKKLGDVIDEQVKIYSELSKDESAHIGHLADRIAGILSTVPRDNIMSALNAERKSWFDRSDNTLPETINRRVTGELSDLGCTDQQMTDLSGEIAEVVGLRATIAQFESQIRGNEKELGSAAGIDVSANGKGYGMLNDHNRHLNGKSGPVKEKESSMFDGIVPSFGHKPPKLGAGAAEDGRSYIEATFQETGGRF